MERQATSARELPRLAPPALDEEFAAEQVDPEIPVHFYPEVPLCNTPVLIALANHVFDR